MPFGLYYAQGRPNRVDPMLHRPTDPQPGHKSCNRAKIWRHYEAKSAHFAQARLSGASGPPPGPIWSVSSSKVACWCLPCLLGCRVGRQRAGCGAPSSLVFRPGCNDQVSQLATRYCLHNACRLLVSSSSSAWVCLLSVLTCMGGMGCPRCDRRDDILHMK